VRFSKEIKVALLGIAAIIALYVGFMVMRGSDIFSRTRTFYVLYDSVDGLNVASPVLLSGISVGSVQELKILQDRGNRVLVTIDIDKNITVGDSTIASLASSDFLGTKAVVLRPGRHRQIYEGGDTLIAHVEQSIGDMISQKTMPLIGTIDTTLMRLNTFMGEEARLSIGASLRNMEATTEALRNMLVMNQQNILQITSNLSGLTASLKESERKFGKLANNLVEITDTLRDARFNDVVRNLNATVNEAQALVHKMNSDTGSLGKLVNSDSLYQNLNHFSENLDRLMVDIRERPSRYVSFSVFGRRDRSNGEKTEKGEPARNGRHAERVEEVKR
jgi:phospholipid/cholesterol/gamma-HCH transport system substrate-binding protein